ncbi:hypothetical protein FOA52_015075 [Chlamydomonas sp. UWO 241]|nr:hypothetical protein FOA52_015075 [Chlamydomonas sp. UWO 241]
MVAVAARGVLDTIVAVAPGMAPVHGGGAIASDLLASLLSCPALNYCERLHLYTVINRAKAALQRPGRDPEGDLQALASDNENVLIMAESLFSSDNAWSDKLSDVLRMLHSVDNAAGEYGPVYLPCSETTLVETASGFEVKGETLREIVGQLEDLQLVVRKRGLFSFSRV